MSFTRGRPGRTQAVPRGTTASTFVRPLLAPRGGADQGRPQRRGAERHDVTRCSSAGQRFDGGRTVAPGAPAARSVHRPPFHSHASAVCTVRQLVRPAASGAAAAGASTDDGGAEHGAFGNASVEDDLEVLHRDGAEIAVRLQGGSAAPGAPAWAALLAGMELGEAARFHGPTTGDVTSVFLLLELRGWIEEIQLPGSRAAGAALYMERSEGVNDMTAGDGGPPGPLAQLMVWYRAQRDGTVVESAVEGVELIVDEPWAGDVVLPDALHGPLDVAVRCMHPREAGGLSTASGWHVSLRLLVARNPKPVYDMAPAEKLGAARLWRELGNACYGAKDWERALNRYVLAAAAVAHADRDSNFTHEQLRAARAERLTVCLNVAATALQLGDGTEALQQSEQALSIDPGSFKGLWRRGKACVLLGDGDRALADLRAALRLATTGRQRQQVQAEISRANAVLKRQQATQREEFGGMFAKAPGCLLELSPTPPAPEHVVAFPTFDLKADFVTDDPEASTPRFGAQ